MQALRTAATGMAAQDLNVQVISNNIANMNTVGFKRQSAVFEDLLYQTQEQPGVQSSDQGTVVPTGVQIGAGVRVGDALMLMICTRGTFRSTLTASGLMSRPTLPAMSVAPTVTVKVPPLAGVVHSSLGLPLSSSALFFQTTRLPCRTVMLTAEIFDSEICTPACVPPRSVLVSSAITGGVCRSAVKCWAVVQ